MDHSSGGGGTRNDSAGLGPGVREDTPIKLCFAVPDLEAGRGG